MQMCEGKMLAAVRDVVGRYGLTVQTVPTGHSIPGSFWGDEEAGLIANQLYVRADTPIHSALHEACHYVCMDEPRRQALHTNAGGDYNEENGVCYLQIILADYIDGYNRASIQAEMDVWGYSFRLGSAQSWFEQDAEDALAWLQQHGIVDARQHPTWRLRK